MAGNGGNRRSAQGAWGRAKVSVIWKYPQDSLRHGWRFLECANTVALFPAGLLRPCRLRVPRRQRLQRGLLHGRTRRRFTGPDLELPHSLLQKHLDAAHYRLALFHGMPNQRRIERIVDHVEYQIGWNLSLEKALLGPGIHAQRRRVYERVEVSRVHVLPEQRHRP